MKTKLFQVVSSLALLAFAVVSATAADRQTLQGHVPEAVELISGQALDRVARTKQIAGHLSKTVERKPEA